MNNLIQIENNQLAQNILKTNYFDYFKKGNQKSLEIFLLGHCSAQCKYCYLKENTITQQAPVQMALVCV